MPAMQKSSNSNENGRQSLALVKAEHNVKSEALVLYQAPALPQVNILESVFMAKSLDTVNQYLNGATAMATEQRLELPESFYDTQAVAMKHSVNLALWYFLTHVQSNLKFRDYVLTNAMQHCRQPQRIYAWARQLAELFSDFLMGHKTEGGKQQQRIVNIIDFVMRARTAFVLI